MGLRSKSIRGSAKEVLERAGRSWRKQTAFCVKERTMGLVVLNRATAQKAVDLNGSNRNMSKKVVSICKGPLSWTLHLFLLVGTKKKQKK